MVCGRVNPPGARPANDISIELEIHWKYVMLLAMIYSADHNEILQTSRDSITGVTCAKLPCDRLSIC